jgi:hypothetical protein
VLPRCGGRARRAGIMHRMLAAHKNKRFRRSLPDAAQTLDQPQGVRTMLERLVVIVGAILGLAGTGSALAQVTLGQTANSESLNCVSSFLWVQKSSTGPSYVVPAAGTVTSWSFSAGQAGTNTEALAILRPTGGDNYTIVAITAPQTIAAATTGTFPVGIPVDAGDLIGLWTGAANGGKCGLTTVAGTVGGVSSFAPVAGAAVVLPPVDASMILNMSVNFVPQSLASVPTLGPWSTLLLVGLLAVLGIALRRRAASS